MCCAKFCFCLNWCCSIAFVNLSFILGIVWFVVVFALKQTCYLLNGAFEPIEYYPLASILNPPISMLNTCIIGDGELISNFMSPDQITGNFSQALSVLDYKGLIDQSYGTSESNCGW